MSTENWLTLVGALAPFILGLAGWLTAMYRQLVGMKISMAEMSGDLKAFCAELRHDRQRFDEHERRSTGEHADIWKHVHDTMRMLQEERQAKAAMLERLRVLEK